jgi:hypothetical protein
VRLRPLGLAPTCAPSIGFLRNLFPAKRHLRPSQHCVPFPFAFPIFGFTSLTTFTSLSCPPFAPVGLLCGGTQAPTQSAVATCVPHKCMYMLPTGYTHRLHSPCMPACQQRRCIVSIYREQELESLMRHMKPVCLLSVHLCASMSVPVFRLSVCRSLTATHANTCTRPRRGASFARAPCGAACRRSCTAPR